VLTAPDRDDTDDPDESGTTLVTADGVGRW
jgi:hypothetical protein